MLTVFADRLIMSGSLQTIVRGSFIGHGDYISHVIAEMSRLSVSSSNSLRRSSPSARKRAQSLGRLGELAEDEPYEYEALGRHDGDKTAGSTYWQDRIRQVRGESGSAKLNGALQRAKSICEVGSLSEATPPDTPSGLYARSEGVELKLRPMSRQKRLQNNEVGAKLRPKPAAPHLPDLLSSSGQSPRRPYSSYDLKVRTGQGTASLASTQ